MGKQLPIISGSVRIDPLQGLKYRVRITGIKSELGFTKIGGLEEEIAVVEYRESTDITTERKLPGRVTFPVVTMEKGLDPDGFMHGWFLEIMNLFKQRRNSRSVSGNDVTGSFRKNIEIELSDRNGLILITWKLLSAWISKLSVGDLDAQSDDVIIETAEIVHEGLIRTPSNFK